MVAVSDPKAGDAVLTLLADAFHQSPPPKRGGHAAGFLKIDARILGTGQSQLPQGGFAKGGGDWTTTEWRLFDEGYAADVCFNYDLRHMQAEFAEAGVAPWDLLLLLAVGLRDGPLPSAPPPTTPT